MRQTQDDELMTVIYSMAKFRLSGFLWLLPLLFFAYHLLHFPKFHTYDALYDVQVLQHPTLEKVLHPHHPLPFPCMILWDFTLRQMGYGGDYFFPAQLLSLIFMTVGSFFFLKIMECVLTNRLLILISFLGLMFSYGTWFIATEIESYAYTACFILAAFFYLTAWKPRSGLQTCLIGVLIGIASLFHETSLLISVPVAFFIILEKEASMIKKFRDLFLIGTSIFLFGLLPYLLISLTVRHLSLEQSLHWLFIYSSMLPGFGKLQLHLAPLGIFESIFGTYVTDYIRGAPAPSMLRIFLILTPGLLMLLVTAALLIRADYIKMSAEAGRFFLLFGVTLLTLGLFWSAWDPVNYEAFQSVLPFFWGLIAVVAAYPKNTAKMRHNTILLSCVVSIIATVNLGYSIPPKLTLTNDPDFKNAAVFTRLSSKQDLLIIYDGNIEHYLNLYFDRPRHTTIHNISIESKLIKSATMEKLKNEIEKTLTEGHEVIVAEEAIEPSSGIMHMHGLEPIGLRIFWELYQNRMTEVGAYEGLSMKRFLGMRSGYKNYRIFKITRSSQVSNQ